jgi:hypothetical protein
MSTNRAEMESFPYILDMDDLVRWSGLPTATVHNLKREGVLVPCSRGADGRSLRFPVGAIRRLLVYQFLRERIGERALAPATVVRACGDEIDALVQRPTWYAADLVAIVQRTVSQMIFDGGLDAAIVEDFQRPIVRERVA